PICDKIEEETFMAVLKIIEYPHPTLSKIARAVEPVEINDAFRKVLNDMIETMIEAPGVGLAAPQVNLSKRFIVVDVSGNENYEDRKPFALINPVIVEKSGKTTYDEGCLSLPDFRETIERSKKIKVNYLDAWGKAQTIEDEDFLAIVIQHEIDHLDGVVAADRVSPMKRMMYLKKLKKKEKKATESPVAL
ncbi:MAG: peptide deformylase, partial [Bacteriovoracaceae bacterium]|nr:peptide deformylase [Bacteriovoracaceae bacterium]